MRKKRTTLCKALLKGKKERKERKERKGHYAKHYFDHTANKCDDTTKGWNSVVYLISIPMECVCFGGISSWGLNKEVIRGPLPPAPSNPVNVVLKCAREAPKCNLFIWAVVGNERLFILMTFFFSFRNKLPPPFRWAKPLLYEYYSIAKIRIVEVYLACTNSGCISLELEGKGRGRKGKEGEGRGREGGRLFISFGLEPLLHCRWRYCWK